MIPMPKINIRGDQLTAVGNYLFQSTSEKSIPSASQVKGEATTRGGGSSSRPPIKSRPELLYQMFCSQCHGIHGNGKGINAPSMFISPRNHTSPEEMGMLTDDRIYAAIRYGGTSVGKSALMPSWGGVIKDSDIKLLVEYVRTLSGTGTAEGTSK
jgi:cytochrome c oxidase cbb3-type subunit 3